MKDKGHGDVRGSPGGHGTMHGGCSLGVQQPQPRDLPSPHPMQDKHYWLLPRVSQPSRSPVPRLGDEPPASICTSRPRFMLHISMYSCRCRFMSFLAVASSSCQREMVQR